MDIDKILLNVLNDKASKAEYEALEVWKNESAQNLHLLNQLQNEAELPYKDFDKNKAWKVVNAQIEEPVVTRGTNKTWLWIFAGLTLFGLVAYGFMSKETTKEIKTFQTADSNINFALADKTTVWLREGQSHLEVISDFETERVVSLNGEAFFDVAHDKVKPFFINLSNNDRVKVVGTSFNILSKGQELDLTVYEGIVELQTDDSTITLYQGDRAQRVNGSIVKYKNNDPNKLSWKNKELVFENSNIASIFQAIEQHYKVNIQHESKTNNIDNCTMRTKFTNVPLEQVLADLAQHLSFEYKIVDKEISISGLSCN